MLRLEKSRAWIEISKKNLLHNLKQAGRFLHKDTKVMAIVKAQAYGHGMVEVSRIYEENGIDFFAVACISEAITLREHGIKSDILILGYTDLSCASLLKEYDLIQAGVNCEYVRELDALELGVRVHLKVDTGMHRIGEDVRHFDEIHSMFQLKNVNLEGLFSHLSVSDMPYGRYDAFTLRQIEEYDALVDRLFELGYDFKTHIQSSSGMINFDLPHFHSYVRPGIMLYGVMSSENDLRSEEVDLRPVLSIKARVGSIKEIGAGEAVGYGQTFFAKDNMKIAVITIGYADGIPRSLSNSGRVLINGKSADIIGRVCMDQLIVDVSEITDIKVSDIATLIGTDGEESISVYEVAKYASTITNEILSSLGERLPRIYLDDE